MSEPPILTVVPKSIDAAGDIAALAKKGGKKRPGRGVTGNGGGDRPAGGTGWGGPSKGPGAGPDELPHYTAIEREAKIADKVQAADEMLVILRDIARASEYDTTRVMAANSVLDRIEGKAVQRIVGGTTDTVEEIRTKDPIEAAKTYQRVIGGR